MKNAKTVEGFRQVGNDYRFLLQLELLTVGNPAKDHRNGRHPYSDAKQRIPAHRESFE
jgi:hypothetical protein